MTDDYTDFDEETNEKKETNKSDEIDLIDFEERNITSTPKPIHKSMMIAEIANNYPDIVPILLENGLHCIGCGASEFETLEEGFYGHGMNSSEVDRIIDDLNTFLKDNSNKD